MDLILQMEFKCNDDHRFEKLNSLSVYIFEIHFYKKDIHWK